MPSQRLLRPKSSGGLNSSRVFTLSRVFCYSSVTVFMLAAAGLIKPIMCACMCGGKRDSKSWTTTTISLITPVLHSKLLHKLNSFMHNEYPYGKEVPVHGWSHTMKFIRFILRDYLSFRTLLDLGPDFEFFSKLSSCCQSDLSTSKSASNDCGITVRTIPSKKPRGWWSPPGSPSYTSRYIFIHYLKVCIL